MSPYTWCFLALFGWAIFLGALAPKNRRPAEIAYPSDEALVFSESN